MLAMMTTIALHGFLGLPSDWDYWKKDNPRLIAYSIKPAESCVTWATRFNEWVQQNTEAPRKLVGYSMGGRLALHALIQNPALWKEAVIISTNIGLKHSSSRVDRLANDQRWAHKFRHEPWDQVMKDWESQSIFKGSFATIRNESDYAREELAQYLENFSLAKQEYLLPEIAKLNLPIQWVTGALDINAEAHAKDIIECHSYSSHVSIPNGTHRVHLEFQETFSSWLLVISPDMTLE